MQKITTHLWFDTQAREAARFYTTVFSGSKMTGSGSLDDTPSGTVDMVTIELWGQEFTLLSAGPLFKFNPSISFQVPCRTPREVDGLWKQLSEGGTVLMELGEYPFSKRYGWLNDKFGLSWQIICVDNKAPVHTIKPFLMFVGDNCGKAADAMSFYTSVFGNSDISFTQKYGNTDAPDKEGSVKYAGFALEGKEFSIMESAHPHQFAFNEAISFMVHCNTQEEIDYYWSKLSAVPDAEQCGWLKDKYGVSWQIVPTIMGDMFNKGSKEQIARVTQAFLKMKKFDIQTLQTVYEGGK